MVRNPPGARLLGQQILSLQGLVRQGRRVVYLGVCSYSCGRHFTLSAGGRLCYSQRWQFRIGRTEATALSSAPSDRNLLCGVRNRTTIRPQRTSTDAATLMSNNRQVAACRFPAGPRDGARGWAPGHGWAPPDMEKVVAVCRKYGVAFI